MQIVLGYAVLALTAFAFHYAWERAHVPLYKDYEKLGTGWRLAVWATKGDVLYTVLISSIVAFLSSNMLWFTTAASAQLLLASAIGILVALFVEYKAMYVRKWSYAPAMPIIPVVRVGLSPIAQMAILTPVVLSVAGLLFRALAL